MGSIFACPESALEYIADEDACLGDADLPAIDNTGDEVSPQPKPSAREVLAGLVERVTYHNAENGFCVLRAKARGHRDVVTVVGHAAKARYNSHVCRFQSVATITGLGQFITKASKLQ